MQGLYSMGNGAYTTNMARREDRRLQNTTADSGIIASNDLMITENLQNKAKRRGGQSERI